MRCNNCGSEQGNTQFCQSCGSAMPVQANPFANQNNFNNQFNDNQNNQNSFGGGQPNPFNNNPNPNPNQFGAPPPFGSPFGFGAQSPDQLAIAKAQKQAKSGLICAIIGLFCFGFVLGLIGLINGLVSIGTLKKHNQPLGNSLAAIVVGAIALIGWIISMVYINALMDMLLMY